MPCDSSYLEATGREKELHRAAQLLVYVRQKQGYNVEPFVQGAANDYYGNNDDRPLKLLCETLTNMDPKKRDKIIYEPHSRVARDLANWWEEHQEADKKRVEAETRQTQNIETRKHAIAKLTKAEREALGIRE